MGLIDKIMGKNAQAQNAMAGLIRVGGTTYNATWNFTRTLDSVYANPTARRCIERMASDFQRPQWQITKAGSGEPLVSSPVLDILNRPNQWTSGTTMQYHISRDLDLGGATFWLKIRGTNDFANDGAVTGLRRLPPQRVTVIGDEDDELLGFIYQNRIGQRSAILPEDLVYIHYPHPERACDRMAPAIVAGLSAETDTAAIRFNFELLANDGGMPGYFSVEGLTTNQFQQWKSLWESGNNPGRTRFIQGSKATYVRTGLSNQELTYKDLRNASQEDICRAMGPPQVIIDPTDATFANMDVATRTYMTSLILPRWTMVADALTLQLGSEFGDVGVGFDLSTIDELSEALDAIVTRGIQLIDGEVITINELRQQMGLDPVAWGDKPVEPAPAAIDAVATDKPAAIPSVEEIDNAFKMITDSLGDLKALPMAIETKAGKRVVSLEWFHRRIGPFEKSAERAMASFFKRQGNAVAKRVDSKKGKNFKAIEDSDWSSIWDDARWQDELTDIAKNMLSGPVDAYGSQTLADINPEATFDAHSDRIAKYLSDRSQDISSLVNGTTSEDLRSIISDMQTNGASVPDVSKAIEQYFEDNGQLRATRVARTEMIGAANWASQEGAKQSGVNTLKQWLAEDDADDECLSLADMDPVALDDSFDDYDAPPAHPNCRCSLTYVVQDDNGDENADASTDGDGGDSGDG